MAQVQWNEADPADTEQISLGDDRIRSMKTSIRQAMDDEHVWPSAGGDCGKHRLGSAKVYYGMQSTVSSTGTDGKLMVTSDTSNLFHVGSAGTMFLGGQRAISAGSSPVGGQGFYWAEEFGVAEDSGGGVGISFPNSGFSGIPFVTTSAWSANGHQIIATITDITQTLLTVHCRNASTGVGSASSVMWRSTGTRTF